MEQHIFWKRFGLFLLVSCVAGCYGAAIFSGHWSKIEHLKWKITHGLWKTCVYYQQRKDGQQYDCQLVKNKRWMQTCRTSAVVASILICVTTILSLLPIRYEKGIQRIFIQATLVFSALFMSVACVLYGLNYGNIKDDEEDLHHGIIKTDRVSYYKLSGSYIFAWSGVLMACLAFVFSVYAFARKGEIVNTEITSSVTGHQKPLINLVRFS